MAIQVFFIVIALVFFAFGAWSRWWTAPQPYYPTLISGGLFFATLAWLWPMIHG